MLDSSSAVVAASSTPSPYQLDIDQTLRASTALLKHVKEETKRLQERSEKQILLPNSDGESEDDESPTNDQPMWLNLSTKQHIVDRNRLAPSKIKVPHSMYKSSSLSICIISADPQRALKDVVADPTFPTSLSSRIGKVIGLSKLKAKYHTFESRRQLLSEYDIFLADERIAPYLPKVLGTVFFKGTTKRPIPIIIAAPNRVDGKRPEKKRISKDERQATVGSPAFVAKEIEAALNSVPVSLKPGTSVAVRVGNTSFTAEQLAENVRVVAQKIIEKHVVKGWRNVKSIHIKSPNSTAIPIWLADDMWVEEATVAEELTVDGQKVIADKKSSGRKRKGRTEGDERGDAQKKVKAASGTSNEDEDRALAVVRKAKLSKQKARATILDSVLVS